MIPLKTITAFSHQIFEHWITDNNIDHRYFLSESFYAKQIRIHPTAYNGSIALRVEVYGCDPGEHL